MASRSLRDPLQRLLVGPRRTALRVGAPAVVTVATATAISTTLILDSNSGGGVFFPLHAVLLAVVASTLYAARYRASLVCVAIGVAALAGSSVGFHALHGDEAVLVALVHFFGDSEPVVIGALFGAVGGAVGGVLGYGYRVWRQRAA